MSRRILYFTKQGQPSVSFLVTPSGTGCIVENGGITREFETDMDTMVRSMLDADPCSKEVFQDAPTPYELGKAAFKKGIAAPVLDPDFMATMQPGPVGINIGAMKEWTRGWAESNLLERYDDGTRVL